MVQVTMNRFLLEEIKGETYEENCGNKGKASHRSEESL